jgi:hypothetical protein
MKRSSSAVVLLSLYLSALHRTSDSPRRVRHIFLRYRSFHTKLLQYREETMSQRRAGRGRHAGACSRLCSLAIAGAWPAQDLLLSKTALLHHKSAAPGPYHEARLTLLHGFVSGALVRRDTQAVYV